MGRSITTSTESAFLTVPTSIGFTAGDLVYNQTGGYGRISDTAVTTATFPIGVSGSPVLISDATNQAQIVWAEYAGCADYTNGAAAKLTNGNIVIPYALNATQAAGTYPYFRIVDSTGATVVAQTQVSATNKTNPIQTPALGALALPNGNFVIYYRYEVAGPAFRLAFRIFDSSGVAQTALITDTTMNFPSGTSSSNLDIRAAARTDSSFVIVGINADLGSPFYRVYSGTTGATVYSGTWGSTPITAAGGFDVVVRSDNSWVMVQLNSVSTVYWEVRSATNVQSAASNYGTAYTSSGIRAVLLSTDTVRLIGMNFNSIGTNLLTGTTMGTETTLLGSASPTYISAYSYDSGTKFVVVAGTNGVAGGVGSVGYGYIAFSSSLAQLSPNTSTIIPLGMFTATGTGNVSSFTFIEVGATIRCYKSTRPAGTANTVTALSGAGVAYAAIDTTTLTPINQQSTAYVWGNSSAISVNGYVAASSTPTQACFYPSASSVQTISSVQSATLLPQTVVESVACNSTQVASLSNGQFAYLYKYLSAPYTIKLAIYNKTGVQTGIVTVDTGSNTVATARMTVLSNGKIMVVYVQGTSGVAATTTVRCKVYSSALVELASTQISANTAATSSISYGPSISALGVAGRAVIGYTNGNGYPNYAVCDDTGAVINTAQIATELAFTNVVCGSRTNTFIFSYTGSVQRLHTYYPTSGTAYTQLTFTNYGNAVNPKYGLNVECGPDNLMLFGGANSTNGTSIVSVDGGSIYPSNSVFNAASFYTSSAATVAMGRTATNITLIFTTSYNNIGGQTYYLGVLPGNNSFISAQVQLTGLSVSTTNGCPSVAPFIADSCVVSLLNTSGFPTFFAFVPYASTQYATLTSGVSVSNAITLSLANRFSLVGVAATTATAGTTGIVQIKGNAQLSNSYSNSTPYQPFDFRNQTTLGIAGSINGRILTLEP